MELKFLNDINFMKFWPLNAPLPMHPGHNIPNISKSKIDLKGAKTGKYFLNNLLDGG